VTDSQYDSTNDPKSGDRRNFIFGALLLLLVCGTWIYALTIAPSEEHQGEVYRILYLHVPAAFSAFFAAFVMLIFSIQGLARKSERSLIMQKAAAEVGLLFTLLTLATGSIWGKPTWNTWWTWDARLTTTFILALLYAGYLVLHAGLSPGRQRITVCSVLGIIIFADVPIIYKSVTWWRTLHQPPSILRRGGSTMHPEILWPLLVGLFILLLFSFWMMRQRARNLRLLDELEMATFNDSGNSETPTSPGERA